MSGRKKPTIFLHYLSNYSNDFRTKVRLEDKRFTSCSSMAQTSMKAPSESAPYANGGSLSQPLHICNESLCLRGANSMNLIHFERILSFEGLLAVGLLAVDGLLSKGST